jgi:uncharacterized protein
VLFPGAVLPLHVFEERYRLLVREGRDFGVVLIREGREVGAEPLIHEVGTLAAVDRLEALPDGRFNLLARGVSRFRVRSLDRSRPYLQAEVEALPEPGAAASTRLLVLLEEYLRLHGLEVAPRLAAGAGRRAVWLAGSILQAEPRKRQRLLESGEPDLAVALLAEEVERLRRLGGPMAPVPPVTPSAN